MSKTPTTTHEHITFNDDLLSQVTGGCGAPPPRRPGGQHPGQHPWRPWYPTPWPQYPWPRHAPPRRCGR